MPTSFIFYCSSIIALYLFARATAISSETDLQINFTVLEQQYTRVEGGRRIIYNRVEPPPVARPVSAAASQSAAEVPEVPAKPMHVLAVSCTIYEGPVAELRWGSEGRQYHAFSNVDFLDVAGIGQFETDTTRYSVILSIGRDQTEARSSHEPALPSPEAFTGNHAQYLLLPTTGTEPSTDSRAMDALHAFYDANKLLLKQQRLAREEENARRLQEAEQRANDPKPDTVINFWPIKSGLHHPNEEVAQ